MEIQKLNIKTSTKRTDPSSSNMYVLAVKEKEKQRSEEHAQQTATQNGDSRKKKKVGLYKRRIIAILFRTQRIPFASSPYYSPSHPMEWIIVARRRRKGEPGRAVKRRGQRSPQGNPTPPDRTPAALPWVKGTKLHATHQEQSASFTAATLCMQVHRSICGLTWLTLKSPAEPSSPKHMSGIFCYTRNCQEFNQVGIPVMERHQILQDQAKALLTF